VVQGIAPAGAEAGRGHVRSEKNCATGVALRATCLVLRPRGWFLSLFFPFSRRPIWPPPPGAAGGGGGLVVAVGAEGNDEGRGVKKRGGGTGRTGSF